VRCAVFASFSTETIIGDEREPRRTKWRNQSRVAVRRGEDRRRPDGRPDRRCTEPLGARESEKKSDEEEEEEKKRQRQRERERERARAKGKVGV